MTTEFGKELRKIRIDRDQVLKDMADRLGVSSSYISSIESGERRVSDKFYSSVLENYNLNPKEKEALRIARAETEKSIDLSLRGLNQGQKQVAINLQRTIKDLDKTDVDQLLEILKRGQGK
ncbi:MAG: helix-turn-helix domain-containing protein [Bacilli bacterium]|jgi:transcriptional regulator with XRE-family HTH domain|nr:helix-turn-helix domain-containing protein [Bacilli bacterium]MCH4210422.1 helix-turn-helix domain-containing protein [Bacilli bacterium]MCH4228834.1 helix-turn-helix domain-containing protein [Bacilli bacterium]MCH4278298.1 helix-turn-helix domain-containing protein [Bacilli bacterium]MCI2055028.1 helix-turn-helix domain-containing protein [Bacilli bacterium]